MAYPTALQSSGPIGMSEVRNWMIAASELPSVSQVGLETLVLNSHLVDQIAPYNLSQFYSYSIPSISCGVSYTITTTYINYREVVVGTISGNVAVGYSVYNDSGGLYDQQVEIEIQYEGGVWTSVLALTTIYIAGVISGSANYIFTYNASSSIIIRVTKSNITP